MPKIVDIIWKVIKNPTEGFKLIKEQKPFVAAVAIFSFHALLGFQMFKLTIEANPEFKDLMTAQAKILNNPFINIFSTITWILIFNAILFFFAKKKLSTITLKEIITLNFFTFIPFIILSPVQFLGLKFNMFFISALSVWIQLIWALILLIIGLKVFLSLDSKDALIIYTKSGLIFILIILFSVLVSAKFLGPNIFISK